jgi:MtN3 and saliva related transmembrane protein
MIDVIGSLAAMLTTLSFVPQVMKILSERRTDGISLAMYSLFTTGVAMWLVYGIMIESWPILLANAVTLSLAATVLVYKIRLG